MKRTQIILLMALLIRAVSLSGKQVASGASETVINAIREVYEQSRKPVAAHGD